MKPFVNSSIWAACAALSLKVVSLLWCFSVHNSPKKTVQVCVPSPCSLLWCSKSDHHSHWAFHRCDLYIQKRKFPVCSTWSLETSYLQLSWNSLPLRGLHPSAAEKSRGWTFDCALAYKEPAQTVTNMYYMTLFSAYCAVIHCNVCC